MRSVAHRVTQETWPGLQPSRPAGRAPARGDLGQTEIVLAADLGSGSDNLRQQPGLLRSALAGLLERAQGGARVAASIDAGYFARQVARAAHDEHICFAIGARRIAQMRRRPGISDDDWTDVIDMDSA